LNKTIFQSAVISSLFTLILVGCGGGGGGGSSNSASPYDVTQEGIAQDATYSYDGSAVTDVDDEGVNPATVTISYRGNDTIEQISITTPTTTVTWDEDNGAIIDDSDVVVTMTNATDTDIGIIANTNDPNINWQYQTFGVWETGRGEPSGTLGAATVGVPTAGSAIPTTGSATFTGLSGGVYVDATGTNDYITASSVTADVNFLNRSVALSTADTTKVNTITAAESPAPNLNMAGTLNYAAGSNAFSGNVSATGLTGSSSGQFYGPNAEELGGVFRLEGAGEETYIGGYGAKQ
jgi:hypothetical protein